MRILVVDDDPGVRRLLSVQLGLAGHQVDIAEDGADALVALGREKPDVLVLDVMMPELNGWQVLAKLRSKPAFAELPVLLLTALDRAEDIAKSHELGASIVMTKPYDGDQLVAAVETLLAQAAVVASS